MLHKLTFWILDSVPNAIFVVVPPLCFLTNGVATALMVALKIMLIQGGLKITRFLINKR